MGKLEYLFRPIRIGSMEVKNRLVMAPMGTNLGSEQGEPTPSMISYYTARARGGVGRPEPRRMIRQLPPRPCITQRACVWMWITSFQAGKN